MAKVLIADDNSDLREMFVEIFECEGHDVISASNGAEAFELFKEQNFDAIISDLEMPQMNGDKLFEEIQAIRPTPMWIMTGRADKIDILSKLRLQGLKDCFTKPVRVHALVDAVSLELNGKAA